MAMAWHVLGAATDSDTERLRGMGGGVTPNRAQFRERIPIHGIASDFLNRGCYRTTLAHRADCVVGGNGRSGQLSLPAGNATALASDSARVTTCGSSGRVSIAGDSDCSGLGDRSVPCASLGVTEATDH